MNTFLLKNKNIFQKENFEEFLYNYKKTETIKYIINKHVKCQVRYNKNNCFLYDTINTYHII